MSIDIFEFYHGAVLAKLLYKGTELKIKAFPSDGNCTFSINNKIGLYIKYSKKRMTPWVFTFKKKHQEEFQILSELHKKTFLALVCGDDGIACLEYDQFKKIFHTNVDDFEWIKGFAIELVPDSCDFLTKWIKLNLFTHYPFSFLNL